jgi:diguanylate cyclase (GGDEF)-like protein
VLAQLRRIPVLLCIWLAAAAVLGVLAVLPTGDSGRDRLQEANDAMESALLRQAVLAEGGQSPDVGRFERYSAAFDLAAAQGLARTAPNSHERALLVAQTELADRWRVAAASLLDATPEDRSRDAAQRAELLYRFGERNADLQTLVSKTREAADDSRHRTIQLIALVLAALAASGAAFALVRSTRRRAARSAMEELRQLEDRRQRAMQEEFARALQGARSEREAQRMLKRQLERALDDSNATVLNRNNSDNRLEAVTAVPTSSPLAATVPEAEPEDCLAVRFGQPAERAAGSAPLLPCELCGALEGSTTCVPSLVGGEVIGSVLVETPEPLDDAGRARLADAVTHAAPVLASMRNLKLAETRAATDALTGLANRRAAEETLKLMVANASRTLSPCAVAMFDLDHFKKVNDIYGHEKGDHLLAAVGDAATSTIRASDFVARFGGEEFLVVLTNTTLEGALLACDKLRLAIAALRIPGVAQGPSASFGVAVFPEDGTDPEELVRGADRALYAAKSSGRNCVRALQTLSTETVDA